MKAPSKTKTGRPTKEKAMIRDIFNTSGFGSPDDEEVTVDVSATYVRLTANISILAAPAEERFEELSKAVESELNEAILKANVRHLKNIQEVPWVSVLTPVEFVNKMDRMVFANDRMLEFLRANLVEHVLIDKSLKAQRAVAIALISKRILDLPATHAEFAQELNILGVKADKLLALSSADKQLIANVINRGSDGIAAEDFAALSRPSNRTPDDVVAQLVDESRAIDEAGEAGRTEVAEPYVPDALAPPALDYPAEWLEISKPIPAGFWDSIGDSPLPYRWEYRLKRDDEDNSVAGMPWPLADEWLRLQEREVTFRNGSEDVEFTKDALYEFVRDYISFTLNIPSAEVEPNWVKSWIYLLWARHHPELAAETYGDEYGSYFAGVRLMVLSMGQSDVRELVPVLS